MLSNTFQEGETFETHDLRFQCLPQLAERSFDIDGEFPESNIQYSEAITLLNNTTNYMKLKNHYSQIQFR